jgi:hypothetical protein
MLAALFLAGLAPTATAHDPNPLFSGVWADHQAVTFRWRSGSEPPSAIASAMRAAATDNNDTRASRGATFAYHSSGSSLIGYGPAATCGVNGIGCFSRNPPTSFTMWLREHGRVFDWGTLRWCQMQSSPTNGCYDAETIALDEFGHVQGLGHHVNYADDRDYTDSVVQTYSRTRPGEGWNMHIYGRCDTAALQLRYDTLDASASYSSCLDLETVLALSANPTSVAYGGTTRMTAILKVRNDDSYLRLRGNPVSDRSVKLQRRPPGGSWTTVATMDQTGTAGTYAVWQTLQTDAEYRAVFTARSGEGLRNDTSLTVPIDVAPCTGQCPLRAPDA